MKEKLQLNPKDILEKEFKTGMKGYKQEEVDQFLDVIMRDYDTFRKEIESLSRELTRLNQENEQLRKQSVSPSRFEAPGGPSATRPQSMQPGSYGATNFDILKRISNLEKAVFGDKL